jgi:hypothetical protein
MVSASGSLLAGAYSMLERRGARRIVHGFAEFKCDVGSANGNQMDGAFGGFDR